jgi:C4-dicarboxylate transporter DctQ subunit
VSSGAPPGGTPRLLAIVHRAEDIVLSLVLGAIVVLAPLQIFRRNIFDEGWIWADPFLRVLVLWVAMLGALAASRQDRQIAVDLVSKFLSPRSKAIVGILTGCFTAVVCSIVAYHSWRFVLGERTYGSTAFGDVPAWLCQVIIPFAFAVIAVRHLGHASRHARVALSRQATEVEGEDT